MRRVSLAIALLPLLAAAAASSGCGAAVETVEERRAITVHPRVVVDGTWELATRGDRVVIDEMLFHVPDVALHADGAPATDVLATDPDDQGPLVFRYDITSDGFGDIVGGERRWLLDATSDARLVFDFEPFTPDVETLSKLEAESGVPLDGLSGHTAMVHGYLLTGSASKSGALGTECDGDPDGNPAACPAQGRDDGDPDGNPADGNPLVADDADDASDDDVTDGDVTDGDVTDGDPDGNPARPKPTDGDPDGNPAKENDGRTSDGDPDGNPADGDPDGNPSQGHPDDDTRSGAMHTQKGSGAPRPVGAAPTVRQRVPFVLVLNREMSLTVPVADLVSEDVAPGEVLPIDLHVQLDELITDELLALLNQEAARQQKGLIVVEIPDVCMEMNVASDAVVHVRRQAVSAGGLKVGAGR